MIVSFTLSLPGSSAGIGAGVAVYFAARGSRLSLTGRDANKLRGVAQRCVGAGLKEEDVSGVIISKCVCVCLGFFVKHDARQR